MKSRPEKSEALTAATDRASSEVIQDVNQGINMSNSTVVTTNAAIATPDLIVVDGQITTTSLQIAEHFGKAHNLVLRTIRNLECSREFNQCNFAPVEYLDAKGEKRPCYRITRDGFVFLAMGFTGKEAAQWKEAYITAFNKMEVELRAKEKPAADPAIDYTRISPAQAQDLREIVKAIVDAKIQGHGETWARFQNKFRVNSYLQLPASRYEEARSYLISKLPNGYAGEVVQENPAMSQQDTEQAFTLATQTAAKVSRTVFNGILSGNEDWKRSRFLVSLDTDPRSEELVVRARQLEYNECILPIARFHSAIEDSLSVDPQVLMRLATTCMNKMAGMAARSAKVLTA